MKGFLQIILQEIMKKMILGTSDAWSLRRSSKQTSEPAYHIKDWRTSAWHEKIKRYLLSVYFLVYRLGSKKKFATSSAIREAQTSLANAQRGRYLCPFENFRFLHKQTNVSRSGCCTMKDIFALFTVHCGHFCKN